MNEKGNENISIREDNSIDNKLDNNIYEPSTPVILEPPKKDTQKVENNKNTILSKLNDVYKEKNFFKKPKEEKQDIKVEKNTTEEPKKELKIQVTHEELYYKNKYLITMVSFFVFLLIAFTVYYYIVMTPIKVFDDAINLVFENFREKLIEYKKSNIETIKVNFNTDINENKTNLEILRDLNIKSKVGLDLKKGNFYTQIIAYKYNNSIFNTRFYLQDGKTYFQLPKYNDTDEDKYVNFNLLNNEIYGNILSYDNRKLTSLYNILEKTRDNMLDIIDEDDLNRKIVFKRVNDTTSLALKVNYTLDKKNISKIYYQMFNKYINDEAFLKEIENITGKDIETIKSELSKLMSKKVSINNITINLYTNLAKTSLISFEIKIDDKYYIEINSLNGAYYFSFIKYENQNEVFNINGKYNISKKTISGEIVIDNENTYSKTKYKYAKLDSNDSLISGRVDLEIYTDLNSSPILEFSTSLSSRENVELEPLNLDNIYTLENEENYLPLSQDDLIKLNEYKIYIKEKCDSIIDLIFYNKLNE